MTAMTLGSFSRTLMWISVPVLALEIKLPPFRCGDIDVEGHFGAGSQFASHLHTEAVVVFLNDYGADGVGVGTLEAGDVVHFGGYPEEDAATGGQIVGSVSRMVGDDVEDGQPVGGFVCCVSIDVDASAMLGGIGAGHLVNGSVVYQGVGGYFAFFGRFARYGGKHHGGCSH